MGLGLGLGLDEGAYRLRREHPAHLARRRRQGPVVHPALSAAEQPCRLDHAQEGADAQRGERTADARRVRGVRGVREGERRAHRLERLLHG